MIRAGLLLVLLPFSISLTAQKSEEKVEWDSERPLVWSDFKATPVDSLSYSANTNSGLSFNWNYSTAGGKPDLKFEVFTYFYPLLSWVKKDSNNSAYLLAHEQLHFDISELHVRILRKALYNYEIGRTIRRDLKSIYNRIESEREAMQNKFDRESSHGENRNAQQLWRNKISHELELLREYQD
ncbi:DUF922 domain-containing protein [Christiangramia salexigens]|uniref:DUF922 domain-containing protein n=1 Tax=Christiangramia salexigens TaxID=1913577 RepID=A0A1L3J4A8_9FLAO|nr:DUF922 domain-containing protein [Christiangramia salexigens]APG59940.1 DUF922 domain-containing protein [Christiangramia salexigens]